ncbi:YihY family inner membrane protein [Helicobacter sp. 13S00477-4]|uniref:YihY family inner membrane protein n=1 Tax=Helicobacter sp. 13S00477-4 TaxID=1905759 RepID=UPI002150F9F3|nr:YihY family inner membrane protein [Helicobacter sp. 13S00477-4]
MLKIVINIFDIFKSFSKKILKKIQEIYNFLTHEQEMFYYAASLSFYTIFALIPLILIAFSIMLNFPDFKIRLEGIKILMLSSILPTHTDIIASFLNTFMENSSKLGSMGFIYIIFTSLMFFRNYEYITSKMFNSKPRKFFDSLIVYWAMMTLFPIAFFLSIYFSGEVQGILKNKVNEVLLPDILLWLGTCILFLILFRVSANKFLNKKALLFTSFSSASIWYLFKWGFVYYVSYNKTYPTLYGSVSVLLIMMLWIYISWLVLLFGMRTCEAFISNFGKKY